MKNSDQGTKRISAWAQLLNAAGGLASKLIWMLVAIVVLAAIGRWLYTSSKQKSATQDIRGPRPAPVVAPIPWHEVDKAIIEAFRASRKVADDYATAKINTWAMELEKRIDKDFLEWYFGYFQQQWLGLKALGYLAAEEIIEEQPAMAEMITEDIQDEFAKRVLRPEIAQMQIERIAQETVGEYVRALQQNIGTIPDKYSISQADWDRYLDDIAVMIARAEGNREVSLTLKTVTSTAVVGGTAGAVKLTSAIKPVIAKIGTKVSTKAAAEGAGKAAAKMAAKTGSKVAAKVGGKFLGAIVGVGVLVWDIWDHQRTKEVERPILRQNLVDYLAEMKHSLLSDPEAGINTMISGIENTMVSSLSARQSK